MLISAVSLAGNQFRNFLKVRHKTVRGYQSRDGMRHGLGLTQRVRSGRNGLNLGELLAA